MVRACQLPVCRFPQRPAWRALLDDSHHVVAGRGKWNHAVLPGRITASSVPAFPHIPAMWAANRHLSSIAICQRGPPCCLFPWQPISSSRVSNTLVHALFNKKKSVRVCGNDASLQPLDRGLIVKDTAVRITQRETGAEGGSGVSVWRYIRWKGHKSHLSLLRQGRKHLCRRAGSCQGISTTAPHEFREPRLTWHRGRCLVYC